MDIAVHGMYQERQVGGFTIDPSSSTLAQLRESYSVHFTRAGRIHVGTDLVLWRLMGDPFPLGSLLPRTPISWGEGTSSCKEASKFL